MKRPKEQSVGIEFELINWNCGRETKEVPMGTRAIVHHVRCLSCLQLTWLPSWYQVLGTLHGFPNLSVMISALSAAGYGPLQKEVTCLTPDYSLSSSFSKLHVRKFFFFMGH